MLKQIAGLWAWLFVHYAVDPNGGGGDPDPDDADNPEGDDPDDPDNADPDAGEEGDAEGGGDSRADNIKSLRKARQEERDARIAAEARLQALETQNRQLTEQARGGTKQQEEVIPADEDATARFVRVGNKVLNENKQQINQATLIAVDAADKVEFYSQASENPLVNKYKAKVEAELQRMKREENNRAPRSLIMRYLIGLETEKAAIEKAKNPGRKTKEQADAEVRTTNARKAGGALPRSDVSGGARRSERQKREERLGDKPI